MGLISLYIFPSQFKWQPCYTSSAWSSWSHVHLGCRGRTFHGIDFCERAWVLIEYVWEALKAWWRHQMKTFSALLAISAGNSPVNSLHRGQWRGALVFSLICAWINGWVNNGEAGDLRHHRAHYGVTVMVLFPGCLLCLVDRFLALDVQVSAFHFVGEIE